MLNPDVRRHIEGTPVAHLATVLPDGSPHTAPLWVDTYGERIVFLTGPGSRKARNLRRDPRVALSLTSADNPFQPVIVRGRILEWIEEARAGGAKILAGGEEQDGLIKPTVIANAAPELKVSCDEVFGPVVTLNAFDSLDEAIELANSTRYGL